jgi:putative tricarboxylic transport membrane protein
VPKNVSNEAYQWWVDTLDGVYNSDNWKAVMVQNGLMPFHKSGADFDEYVQQQVDSIKEISTEIGLIK